MKQVLKVLVCTLALASGQQQYDDYGDNYGQDNLYHDYAMKQQEKELQGWVQSMLLELPLFVITSEANLFSCWWVNKVVAAWLGASSPWASRQDGSSEERSIPVEKKRSWMPSIRRSKKRFTHNITTMFTHFKRKTRNWLKLWSKWEYECDNFDRCECDGCMQ